MAGRAGAIAAAGRKGSTASQALLPSNATGAAAGPAGPPSVDDSQWRGAKVKTAIAFTNMFKMVRDRGTRPVDAAAISRAGQMSVRARMAKKRPNVDGANGQKATTDEMFIRQLVNELPFAPPVFNEETQALPIPVHADSIAYEPGWRIRSAPSKPLTAPLSADGALGGPWHRPKDRAAQMTYLPLPSAFDFNSPTGFAAGDGVMLAFAPPQTVVSRPRIGAAAPQTLAVPVPLGRNRSASGSTSGSAASVHSELSRRPSWEQEETTIALAVPAPINDEAVGRKKTLKERLLGRS